MDFFIESYCHCPRYCPSWIHLNLSRWIHLNLSRRVNAPWLFVQRVVVQWRVQRKLAQRAFLKKYTTDQLYIQPNEKKRTLEQRDIYTMENLRKDCCATEHLCNTGFKKKKIKKKTLLLHVPWYTNVFNGPLYRCLVQLSVSYMCPL